MGKVRDHWKASLQSVGLFPALQTLQGGAKFSQIPTDSDLKVLALVNHYGERIQDAEKQFSEEKTPGRLQFDEKKVGGIKTELYEKDAKTGRLDRREDVYPEFEASFKDTKEQGEKYQRW